MRALALLTVALAIALAGCGGADDDAASRTSSPALGTPVPGGGLSVQEAIDSDLEGPLLVQGHLIDRAGEVRLCSAILESYPPQCGEPSLRVAGADLVPSEEPVSLLGEVEDGTITVSETATG